jgi:outer membrane biosynthesis protein TonB
MSAAEMHAMEKAALQDPFLADAIEGYNEASTVIAAQHLNEINASLSGRYETPKVVAFNPTRRWMRIAALIILLAGVGLTATYVLNRSNSKLNVAELKPDNAKKNAAPAQTDSQQAKAAETLKSEEPKIHDTQKKMKTADPEVERVPEVTRNDISEDNPKTADEQADVATLNAPAAAQTNPTQDDKARLNAALVSGYKTDTVHFFMKSKNLSTVTITGKVLDANGEPIPSVIVQSLDRKQTVLTNFNGEFNLNKQDSLADVTASAIGFESKNERLRAGAENLIVLMPAATSLNEVVVTALGVKRAEVLDSGGAVPVGGWQNFNTYVQQRLIDDTTVEDDDRAVAIQDLVELEFSIDKAGNPTNIRLLQSLDQKRNARAVDILRRGPKWISTENKKVRIRISF